MSSSSPSRSVPRVQSLFRQAHAAGELSAEALETLTSLDADMGARIQAGLGVSAEDVPASEVVLVTIMPDDSSSIRSAGNEDAVRDGHNEVLAALKRSRQAADVLAHTRYLNGEVLFPYRPLGQATRMSPANYRAEQGTPLYDQVAVLLGTVLAKTREFETAGVPVRTVTLLITDGGDMHSTRQSAASVRALVEDMLRSETHVIAALGVEDGSTDFRAVFRSMGIRDEWILTPSSDPEELQRAFRIFSRSAVQVSQGLPAQGLGGGFWGSN